MNFVFTKRILATAAAMWLAVAGVFAAQWALPRVSISCVRLKPSHSSNLETQVVMGTPLQVTADHGSWAEILTPEGYPGFVIKNNLTMLSEAEFKAWQNSDRVIVTALDRTYAYSTAAADPAKRVTDLVNGAVLVARGEAADGWLPVSLPDGRQAYVAENQVMPIGEWARRKPKVEGVLECAWRMTGSPYLWGGTSNVAADCSGFTKVAFFSQGILLPRNASQQAKIGEPLPIDNPMAFQPGDLLFFGNPSTGRVTHVAISLGDGLIIHSSGLVSANSIVPGLESIYPYVKLNLLAARRIPLATFEPSATTPLSVLASKAYFP